MTISDEGKKYTLTEKVADTGAGLSVNSLLRGLLGMAVLILIAFLFSSNRRAINWKVVGIGLGCQLLFAILIQYGAG